MGCFKYQHDGPPQCFFLIKVLLMWKIPGHPPVGISLARPGPAAAPAPWCCGLLAHCPPWHRPTARSQTQQGNLKPREPSMAWHSQGVLPQQRAAEEEPFITGLTDTFCFHSCLLSQIYRAVCYLVSARALLPVHVSHTRLSHAPVLFFFIH